MLNRRHLRVKILETLYAHHSDSHPDSKKVLVDVDTSVQSMKLCYLLSLRLLAALVRFTDNWADQREAKMMMAVRKMHENRRFASHPFPTTLEKLDGYRQAETSFRLSAFPLPDIDQMTSLFKEVVGLEAYQNYINLPEQYPLEDFSLLQIIYKEIILPNEMIDAYFEEISIHWETDKEWIAAAVLKTLKEGNRAGGLRLVEMSRDWPSDLVFCSNIVHEVCDRTELTDARIKPHLKGWELERVAFIDLLILRMALAEMVMEQQIPVKVTLNEYLELAKSHSTPKSSIFVNGVLDALSKNLQAEGVIVKSGRGLITQSTSAVRNS
ncbi:MAG: transcription antitermination factor NusB [Sphingomonadales bacterium]|nr:transcription antitermination factor NusB [Sphingomonadales bacterium]